MTMRLGIFCACALLGLSGCGILETEPREHVVKIVSDMETMRMSFQPRNLTVAPGDTVTWVNMADVEHNVMTYPDGFPRGAQSLNSPYITKAGEQWSFTFETEGTYEYHCVPHVTMGMHGSVVVGKASGEGDYHQPTEREIERYQLALLEYFDEDELVMQTRTERHISGDWPRP